MDRELVTAIATYLVSRRSYAGSKAFQKLFYLIESAGVPTRLDFSMHYYGPYSFALADEMYELARENVLQTSPGEISPGADAKTVLDKGLQEELGDYRGTIDRILDAFGGRSGRELELIATTHLVLEDLGRRSRRVARDEVIAAVEREKHNKFRRDEIERALKQLDEVELLPAPVG